MSNELEALRKRVRELEIIAIEYERLQHLAEYAAQGQAVERFSRQSVLYVNAVTMCITDVTGTALDLLGYSKHELLGQRIDALETLDEDSSLSIRTYTESSNETAVYTAFYRHRLGHRLLAYVHKRRLNKPDGVVLHYQLEDRSIYGQLWSELQRREDNGFKFQQKLKVLTEITIELSQIDTFDSLCWHIIKLGIDRLGFDRLGLWFLDNEHRVMVGSYGVDEQGSLRPEHQHRWSYQETYVLDFIAGKTEASLAYDDAPIYNDNSEIIEYGWHISAPLLHGKTCVGVITSDNYLRKQLMKSYEPELLRLYGITVGHLTELARVREEAMNIRLKQARNQMLRDFITNVGHDFKTPLSVVNTKSFLIQRAQTEEQREVLARGIEEQVMYINKTLDDILEFIELERDLVLNPIITDLKMVLTSVIDAYQELSIAKNIQWDINFEHVMRVPADLYYLQRALSEIFDNAINYTSAGGWVRVRFVCYPHEIGIRIEDTGIGIEPQALDKLFLPLYRVDEARSERRSGFGLAIAKAIIEAHQGRIVVESRLGQGSTFEVILPQT